MIDYEKFKINRTGEIGYVDAFILSEGPFEMEAILGHGNIPPYMAGKHGDNMRRLPRRNSQAQRDPGRGGSAKDRRRVVPACRYASWLKGLESRKDQCRKTKRRRRS